MTSRSNSTRALPLTPLIGRQAELQQLLQLLQDPSVRLVTILGPGGIGKTRLALEAIRSLQDHFHDGAVFIPLAQLNSIEELLPAVAGALQVQLPPEGDLQQAVLDHLSERRMLLVLDNLEHLLDEALLINDILVAAPGVKVLVTSREKLSLDAEILLHVNRLPVPPAYAVEDVGTYAAAQLFLQRAGQSQPGFAIAEANTGPVVRICRSVDGNPLGILLAASRVEHFSPAEIADQIDASLDFLSRDSRDGEPRHFGMRAVFKSSFSRLNGQLQDVFRRLSVFCGGFDLAAAQAVTGANLATLIALVDKSLLTRDLDSGRYDLHVLLRQYAAEELARAGDRDQTLLAHLQYFTAFVRDRTPKLASHEQRVALDELQTDFDNIRRAWTHVIDQRDFQAARAMLPCLYAYCDHRSRFYEGEALARLAVDGLAPERGEPPNAAWALALLSWYDMRLYFERFESCEEITAQARACLEYAASVHDAQGEAASRVLLAAILEDQSNYEAAVRDYAEGLRRFPALDNAYWVNMRIGLCYQSMGKYAEADKVFHKILQGAQEAGTESRPPGRR